jgi:hypothetical protein
MAQATEVVQANESNNFAFTKTSTSSNKLIDSMLDNMELNEDNMGDNNICVNIFPS